MRLRATGGEIRKEKTSMGILKRVCMVMIAVVIPVVCILGAGMLVSRTPDFYSYEFSRLKSIEDAGLAVKAREMASLFADFINGKAEEFQIKSEYRGDLVDLFTAKEQTHMADVKLLIGQLTVAFGVGLILFTAGVVALVGMKDKGAIRKAYLAGVGIYVGTMVALLFIILMNFTAGFTAFHEIFFTNDLWQLNPEEDVLLMIMPQKFFLDGALVVLGISTLILSVTGAVIWRFTKERKMFYTD